MEVRLASTEEVRPLRAVVLRPGLPFETSLYPEDPDARHYVVEDHAKIEAVVSFVDQPMHGDTRSGDVRFRGMAVAPDRQGQGLGGRLLEEAIARETARGGRRFWCHARDTARRFYLTHGFEVIGDGFEIEGIGPHHVMWRGATG